LLLLEHEGKALLREYGIPVPDGVVATAASLGEALARVPPPVMVKAQIPAGGRGKAGGILAGGDASSARAAARQLLGSRLKDHLVEAVLIEPQARIERELYLSITFDGADILLLVGSEGGVEVESFFSGDRHAIETVHVDPLYGASEYQLRKALDHLGVPTVLWAPFARIAMDLFRLFRGCDAKLAEINPLAVTGPGELTALDARIEVDEGAFFRQPRLDRIAKTRSPGTGFAADLAAIEVQYVPMGGNIGLVSQGAGAGVTIMDWASLEGGRVAAFVDVDYAILTNRTEAALRLLLGHYARDPEVKAIIVNFTTCGVRLDLIANDLIKVMGELGGTLAKPVFMHLQGNRSVEAHAAMAAAGHPLCASLGEAVRGACRAAAGGRA
jgi:succinyl-CoA synthetase beta subunit